MPQLVVPIATWIGNVVAGAAAAVGISATAAAAIGAAVAVVAEIAIYAGLNAIIDDLSRQKVAPMGQELQLRVASDVAREMIVGIRLQAGSMVARYSHGSNLYNAHFVYQVADHPCSELSKVFAEGRVVQGTPLTHGARTVITAYSYSGGPRVWMTWHDGRPGQTYDADLVTKSALDPDVVAGSVDGWTTAHVGAGCAYVHVEVQWDSDILTAIPQFLFQVKGAPFYDRRKDTTAGGSGSHRLDDPDTWEYTTNAAVVTDHYMLGYQVEADPLAFGLGLSKIEVPYATFEALADLADEDVTTGTGGAVEVIKRYAINAIISTAEAFETVLENFQNQMSARIVDLGGRIGILGGEARTATVTLTDDAWASDDSVRFADKLPFSSLFGAVIGSFPDPGNMYQPTPYDRQTTAYLQLPDGGEAQTAQLDLPMETHPRRAVRLAAAWIARESLQPRLAGVFATRSLAWKLEAGDWFELTSARLQVTAAMFEVIDTIKYDDFTVAMTARAIDPAFLAFSTSSDPSLSVPPAVLPYSYLLDPPTFDVVAGTLTAGSTVTPTLDVTLTSNETVAREIVLEYGVSDPLYDPMTDPADAAILGTTIADSFHISQIYTQISKGILPTTDYRMRAKAKAGDRESIWTDWSAVITTGAASGADGVSNAVVALYKRSASAPAAPSSGTATYTFATGVLASPPSGWTQAIPTTDGNPLYVITALASANTATDTIGFAEWSSPVVIVQDGTSGGAGANGLNNATVTLYQRHATGSGIQPASGSATYTFATGVLTSIPSGWTQTVPAGTNPLYAIYAVASSNSATDTIAFGEWSTAVLLVQNGTNGTNGTNGSPGADAITASITNAAMAVLSYADGTVVSFAGVVGQMSVFSGGADVTASATFSIPSSSGVTGSINTATNTPVTGARGSYRITAMSADEGYLTLRAVYGGVTIDRVFSVSKNKVGYEILASDPATNLFAGRIYFNTSTGKLRRYFGGAWIDSVAAADITGTLADAQIAALAASKLTGTITSAQIGTDQITATLIAAGAVGSSELAAGAVIAGKITAGAIVAGDIATDAITAVKIQAGAIVAGKIAAGAIAAGDIAAGAITAGKIAAGAIVAADIATDAITASKVQAGAITAAKMSVTSLAAISATIGLLRTASTGARTEIEDNVIRVYDASNVLRVRLGIW